MNRGLYYSAWIAFCCIIGALMIAGYYVLARLLT
jgi:hypothetical protein